MKYTLFVIAFALCITTGFVQSTYSQKGEKKEKAAVDVKAQYACPMHPEVKSDKPGSCSKCGMNLVLAENEVMNQAIQNHDQHSESTVNSETKTKIGQARSLLREGKQELAQDGKYNCCIKDPCDRCALDHQSCDCAEDVKAGKAVCPDCYAGWQRGDGIVKGVKAKKVKGSFHSHKHND